VLERDDARVPETESAGHLDPPRRPPPTAVGAGTPDEEQPRRRPAELYDLARLRGRAHRRPALPVRLVASLVGGVRGAVGRQLRKARR
jgi:hypothetical protein